VFNYDANGNLLDFLDPNSNKTRYEYDTNNRLTKKIYADNTKVTLTYDALGRTATRTNARGITATYSYDVNSNLTGISYSDTTPAVSYTYDEYNRVTQRQDAVGIYKFTYDNNDRLTSVDGPWENDTISYTYDALGRRIGMTPQGGETVNWGYDRQGRLKTVTVGGDSYQYAYDGVNPLVKTLTRPNGSITRYQYDNLARLTQLSNEKSDGTIINRFDYTYNAQDLRATETITNGDPITNFEEGLITYQTNELNQLTSSTNPSRTYEYDADGNMTKGYTPAGYVFTATYDAADRLSTLTFTDSSGVIYKTEYVYQDDGFVGYIKKSQNDSLISDTRFIRDDSILIQERNQNNSVEKSYAWASHITGGIGLLLRSSKSNQNHEYLYDAKGNVMATLNQEESILSSHNYSPFGIQQEISSQLDQPFRFSTKYYDNSTGLSDFGYRYYASHIGKWLNRDPIMENGDINLYAFTGNDPINYVDPNGYDREDFKNYVAGLGDMLSLGTTRTIREDLLDVHNVDYCSQWYGTGNILGGLLGIYTIAARTSVAVAANAEAATAATAAEIAKRRAIRSLEKQIAKHQKKLQEFINNPTIRPGMENLPKELIQKQQQRRVQHLLDEINTFGKNIEKIQRGEHGL
jgi:RHS repeat-associated protein